MSRLRAALAVGLLLSACHGEPAPVGPEPLAEAGEPLLLEVGELAELDGGASEHAVAYRWSFGDGESADGERVSHAWAEPGHWTAVLQVESADGRTATDSVRIDVVWPLAEERPVSARALSFDASGERIYAVLPDFDAVAVVERSTGELLGHLEVCDEPLSVSSAELLDRIVVACRGGNAFEVWQDGSRIVSAEMTDPGAPPLAAVMDEAGEWVFVVHGGLGAVSGWELSPVVTERWRRTDLPDSRGLARVGDQLLVSRFRSSGEGGRLWSFSTDPEVQDLVQVTLAPDPGPDSDTTSRGVPSYLQRVLVSPDGRRAWLPSLQANIERGQWRDGLPLTQETTARAILSQLALDSDGLGAEGARKVFDDRDLAVDVALSPRGDWAYVAMSGMEAVDILDAYTLETAGSVQGVGRGLSGVLVSPEGDALWVLAELSRELVSYPLDRGAADSQEILRLDLRPGGEEVLAEDILLGKQLFHRASDPRLSRDGYLSCASCHFEGGSDGFVWDLTHLGEGLRSTTSLLGVGSLGAGPLHWSGNFDEVQDFEGTIRSTMGGSGLLEDGDWVEVMDPLGGSAAGRSAELDALAAYVLSLEGRPRSPWRAEDGGLTAQAELGRTIFHSAQAGCSDCHPAPSYTDSQWLAVGEPLLHDVGTLTEASGQRLGDELSGLDTPSLRGVFASAPYLHDGSAETLYDVLVTRNPEDLHGGTSHLTVEELEALQRFLLEVE